MNSDVVIQSREKLAQLGHCEDEVLPKKMKEFGLAARKPGQFGPPSP